MKRRFTTESGFVYEYERHLPSCPLQKQRPLKIDLLQEDTIQDNVMQDIDAALDAATRAKQTLVDRIGVLPDNPRIQRLTYKCFVIMSSDLDDNWTPNYHDFRLQYRLLQALVMKTPFEKLKSTLEGVVTTGTLPVTTLQYDRGFKFHPTVIKNLKNLLS